MQIQLMQINMTQSIKIFFDVPLSICIERDKNRDLQVTEKVIRDFYIKYKNIYHLNGD